MATEPPIDHAALLVAVRSSFGLDVESLTFLPAGTAPAYRAVGLSGKCFLKVMPPTGYGDQVTARALAELPLLRALRSTGTLGRVPEPMPTVDGGWVADVDGYRVFAYGWIDAVNLGSDWEEALPELALLLGQLHAGTASLLPATSALPMPPEEFGMPFEALLTNTLRTLLDLPAGARPGLIALRDLLVPQCATILRVLDRAQAFAERARHRAQPLVVCHTDAHGGNVMRDATGNLWLVDWETARLAPPEHDLWMLYARLAEVLPAYRAGLGTDFTPDLDTLGFYLCRRPLEDLAADIGWMLHEHTRPEQDAESLGIIEKYVLPALWSVEADLERLASALSRTAHQAEHTG